MFTRTARNVSAGATALLLALALSACGGGSETETTTAAEGEALVSTTEEEAQAPRCAIVMRDVTKYIIPIVRTIVGPPKVKMELVLSKTPDTVEATFTGFYISSFSYNADSVTADLSMVDYEREPFPMHSFTPAYFPGMF